MAERGPARKRIIPILLALAIVVIAVYVAVRAIPSAERPTLIRPGHHTATPAKSR